MKQVGSNNAVVTTDGTVTYNSYANGVLQSSGELTGGLSISEYWKYIDFEYRVNSVLVDKERVFIVSDGINGVDGVDGTDTKGTGNFGNYPIYIGRRGGTSLPFNGHIYSLIGVGRLATVGEIAAIEKELAKRTGVTLSV